MGEIQHWGKPMILAFWPMT